MTIGLATSSVMRSPSKNFHLEQPLFARCTHFFIHLMRPALIAIMILGLPSFALADKAIFPPGSSVGITPPEGMLPAGDFLGFEDQEAGAVITLYELPAEAFERIAEDFTPESMMQQGILDATRTELTIEGTKSAILITGKIQQPQFSVQKWILIAGTEQRAALIVGEMVENNARYDEESMRAAILSLIFRERPSLSERNALLPFRVGDRADFQFIEAPVGSALILTDGEGDVISDPGQPIIIIDAIPTDAPPPNLRDDFARGALMAIQGLADIRVERSEGFRQRNDDWHEIVAEAKDPDGNALVVMQTIRFSREGLFRALATVRAEDRSEMMPRFRRVIDSLEPR